MIYIDTSAALKLIWKEQESAAVVAMLEGGADLTASSLLAVKARRAAIRDDA